jgi:putative aldouronate transport system substrate-binding protein
MSPIAGLIPNTDSIKTEIAKRDALYDQIGKLLVFGAVTDVDKTLDDYIAKQKAAGLDKILAEVQKQVNAWITAK